MNFSRDAIDLIKHFEGLSLTPYKDQAGHNTIGYGHLIKKGEVFGDITEHEAENLLIQDMRAAENAVNRLVKVQLHQEHFDALVSFVFNVGARAFSNSTLLKKLNRKDFVGAADEFLRWNKVTVGDTRKVSRGLVRRREAERRLFLSLPWRGE